MVHNRCLNYIYTIKFTQRDDYFVHASIPDAETKAAGKQPYKIMNAIEKLPEKCREVFELCKLQEMKYAEVGQLLGFLKTVEIRW